MVALDTREEFEKKVNWFKENLKIGQTIKFKENFINYGDVKTKEYRGIYLGLYEGTRTIHIQVGVYDKENNTTLKKEFNMVVISDLAPSRLPKVVSEDIKKKFMVEDNESNIQTIKDNLDNQVIIRSFKKNTFLLLNKELGTLDDNNHALGRIHNLKLPQDVSVLTQKYPKFKDNFASITNNHFKNFVNNGTISICHMVLAKPSGSKKTIYYQATEIKLNKKLSPAKQKDLIEVLRSLSSVE